MLIACCISVSLTTIEEWYKSPESSFRTVSYDVGSRLIREALSRLWRRWFGDIGDIVRAATHIARLCWLRDHCVDVLKGWRSGDWRSIKSAIVLIGNPCNTQCENQRGMHEPSSIEESAYVVLWKSSVAIWCLLFSKIKESMIPRKIQNKVDAGTSCNVGIRGTRQLCSHSITGDMVEKMILIFF